MKLKRKSDSDEEMTLVKMIVSEVVSNASTLLIPNNNVIEKVKQGLSADKLRI